MRGWFDAPLELSAEQLILAVAFFWTLAANSKFLIGALQGRSSGEASSWGFGMALAVGVWAIHTLLLSLVGFGRALKPLIAVLLVVAASAAYFISTFGVYVDPSMLRNVVRTDPAEAGELIGGAFALHLALFAGLPLLLLWRVKLVARTWKRAALLRVGLFLLAFGALIAALMSVFQPLSSLMRNHKELRYLITPANVLWSSSVVIAEEFKGAAQPRVAIGLDAKPGASWAQRRKPLVVVMVVGETARAANWGLSGYARQTTPELAAAGVINFPQVSSCGTNTEVSLPCMFAPVGRRAYDEGRIRAEQSLLHVLSRAGVGVHWRDNQSGCKGVCEGLPTEQLSAALAPGLCAEGRCMDEGLVHDLDRRLAGAQGTQFWVLHMLGSHGPSYFRRYPPGFARFQPECRQDELQRCAIDEIVNAYDNSLLYTDHVVATAVAKLRAAQDQVDSALIFVSDHGESLGEKGLFLHGIPYAIAPQVQTRVPMVMWTSPGLEAATGLKPGCLQPRLQQRGTELLSHDNLFHTVLGLLDVRTALHEPKLDLTQGCAP